MRTVLVGARPARKARHTPAPGPGTPTSSSGAAQQPKDLVTDVADSAMALRTIARQLPDQVWPVPDAGP